MLGLQIRITVPGFRVGAGIQIEIFRLAQPALYQPNHLSAFLTPGFLMHKPRDLERGTSSTYTPSLGLKYHAYASKCTSSASIFPLKSGLMPATYLAFPFMYPMCSFNLSQNQAPGLPADPLLCSHSQPDDCSILFLQACVVFLPPLALISSA